MIRIILLMSLLLIGCDAKAFCIPDSEVCVEGAETRNINGHNVHKSCWRWTAEYTCDGVTAVAEPHCQDLINEGCSPISQVCDEDSCTQTYECGVGVSTTQQGSGCDNQSMSVGSLDYDTGYTANNDFGLAASNMAAVEDAVTGMLIDEASCSEQPPGSGVVVCIEPLAIFQGKGLGCRKDSVNFRNCCKLGGWGTDAGLTMCNAEEHELGYARQADLTHYVGRYCSGDNAFGCYERTHVYCKFNSEIGRIIQVQGRAQLGMGWGSAKNPDCDGFTETELVSINFDLIDFSGYFGNAFADAGTTPTAAEMESIVNSFINKLQTVGCSQFDTGCVENLP